MGLRPFAIMDTSSRYGKVWRGEVRAVYNSGDLVAPCSSAREVIAMILDSEDERRFYANASDEEREAYMRGGRESQ